ncbi:MAG: pilus assembly protein PilM [Pirellulaceae bacterium]|nr:MAG: pilus assembly protein PilM [Pirellulaceae bacterium]
MIQFWKGRHGPIGVDIGSRSIKLVQFSADRRQLVEKARWEWEAPPYESEQWDRAVAEALRSALAGRNFRGRRAVLALTDRQLYLQSVRVPRKENLTEIIHQEMAGRLPYPFEETMLDYWESADIRQGDSMLREVIVIACHQPVALRVAQAAVQAGLHPVALDVEPAAIIRSYCAQYRRDDERTQCALLVHLGYSNTAVIICQFDQPYLVKYLDFGGRQMDECVAESLHLEPHDAHLLRRQLPAAPADLAEQIVAALRPALEKLTREISLCVRYHTVTFRGRRLERMLVGGGEASRPLADQLGQRLGLPAELSDPFRRMASREESHYPGLWDVAAGLALRSENPELAQRPAEQSA